MFAPQGYIKGAATVILSLATLAALQHFGAEIGQKFHLVSNRAVVSRFVPGDTLRRREGREGREGAPLRAHSRMTPLWRLDR